MSDCLGFAKTAICVEAFRKLYILLYCFHNYEKLPDWHAENVADLLSAHQTMMFGLIDDAGKWRSSGVGVFRNDELVHMAPPASQIPRLMSDLLEWLAETENHPLITSCAFHYEFEFIHPFSDGNSRMGRLWQTLILSQWRALMAYLPVETLISERQDEYYFVLGQCDKNSDSTLFIEFMLQTIENALRESF